MVICARAPSSRNRFHRHVVSWWGCSLLPTVDVGERWWWWGGGGVFALLLSDVPSAFVISLSRRRRRRRRCVCREPPSPPLYLSIFFLCLFFIPFFSAERRASRRRRRRNLVICSLVVAAVASSWWSVGMTRWWWRWWWIWQRAQRREGGGGGRLDGWMNVLRRTGRWRRRRLVERKEGKAQRDFLLPFSFFFLFPLSMGFLFRLFLPVGSAASCTDCVPPPSPPFFYPALCRAPFFLSRLFSVPWPFFFFSFAFAFLPSFFRIPNCTHARTHTHSTTVCFIAKEWA